MSKYRVDRNDSTTVTPVGMNSLLYLGNSEREAHKVFNKATGGRDAWNSPNQNYGVTISKWDDNKNSYVVIGNKDFPKK